MLIAIAMQLGEKWLMAASIPIQGTEVATRWDSLYYFLFWLSWLTFILVIGGMCFFLWKYRHQVVKKTQYITGSHLLEAIWIAVPTLLLFVIFVWGFSIYRSMVQAPIDSYEIRVLGKQWLWTFQYDHGKTTVGDLYVPIHQPVKLIMTSEDVLHGFFVPSFRVKQDVVPGMYTTLWFKATVPGKHQIYCTQYCGTSHSTMLGKVIVLDDQQWQRWLDNKPIQNLKEAVETANPPLVVQKSLVQQGKRVYETRGCVSCHASESYTSKIGPSLRGLFGKKVELSNGSSIVADENYIRTHIENPRVSLIKGYSPVMPAFKGLIDEVEMNALIAFIKSLKD